MTSYTLEFTAGIAAGLMIVIERGWRLRPEKCGMRVAGVRTYTLLGASGALAGILGNLMHPMVAVILVACLAGVLLTAFARDRQRRDATGIISALLVVALGLLAGAGHAALAVAGSAVVTLILATRNQSHRFVAHLNATDVRAFARYAVIGAAVLLFLPNRAVGPLGAWNPFQLWLVVVLITGFSFAGYIAYRTIGARKGVLATALIGGAYSSTAVTASFAERLAAGEVGPLSAGIMIASAVMYVRVIVLVGVLSPSTLVPLFRITAPATVVGMATAAFAWFRAQHGSASKDQRLRNPAELVPVHSGEPFGLPMSLPVSEWAAQALLQ